MKSVLKLFLNSLAYLAAAITFILATEVLMQAIYFVKSGDFLPLTEARIACAKVTFFFLLLAGFLVVKLGHFTIKLSKFRFRTVIKRHSFAYAVGYMLFVLIGVACLIFSNPEIGQLLIAAWWVYITSALLLFAMALIAGTVFAHIYDRKV